MHYVYVENNLVVDQCQLDPYKTFNSSYAAKFIEAADEVTFGWSYIDGVFTPPPAPVEPTPEQIQADNKYQAKQLLSETDWTTIPDVSNPSISTPHLTNASEFAAWRSQIRAVAINPPTNPVDFPAKPNEQWSS